MIEENHRSQFEWSGMNKRKSVKGVKGMTGGQTSCLLGLW